MHPYVPFLIEDIQAAERPEGPMEEFVSQSFEEEMEAIERWVCGEDEPHQSFGAYCGLSPEDFPPAEQLSDRDISLVCNAFEHLLFTWNADIDLPDNLPPHTRYKLTVNTLTEGFVPVNSGIMTFDFCSGYAPDCALGKYCRCLDYWYKERDE